jgi:cytochrome b6-f complex iron-sulfur subunit
VKQKGQSREQAAQPAPPATGTRRSFLGVVWAALGAVLLGEVVWVGLSFLRPRSRRPAADDGDWLLVAGPIERFAPGTVTAFQRGKLYLARLEDGGFLALSRSCTHLGCTVPGMEEEQRFVCPCHASVFAITGEVVSAPAPRPLDLFPVRIENQIVKVDTRTPISRSAYSPDQVARG